ncbi:hypothetical protein RJT34_19251 [Clitoria ternatea]|uniref:BHLH domain-containing protein n=1 Tax=Clitoria ternatea TaxID=43366 RepID=A0AAN9IQP7_CLITE
MLDFTPRSSSHVPSMYNNDFLELVWENGQVVARGSGSSNTNATRKITTTPYSISPSSNNKEKLHREDASITKKTRFNTLYSILDQFPSQRDSDTTSSHQTNGQESFQSPLQSRNFCKLDEDFANLLRPVKDSKHFTTGNSDDYLCAYSSQQYSPSAPQKKQRTDSNKTPAATNSHNLVSDQRTRNRVNFSNFLIPAVFLKSTTCEGNSATQHIKNVPASSAKVDKEIVDESAKGFHGLEGFQNKTPTFVEKSAEPLSQPFDEHSEAVGHTLRAKRKADNEPLVASSSACSLGASNDPNLGMRKHEDTDDSTYLSDNEEEQEDIVKHTLDREGSRVKKSRNAEVHNLSEKKRREKINKRMRTLKELIPNCNKVDKASMLDDAIEYLKTLKLQLQIMSMGSGLWPLMMLPAAANHINGPHLPHQLMGFRPPQLPISPLSAVTDNRLQMFGFSNQMPHMPIPHAPFFPMVIGNSSAQPHRATTTNNNLVDHLANSAPPHVTVPQNSDFHAKEENATKQELNQVHLHHHSTTTNPLAIPFVFPQK